MRKPDAFDRLKQSNGRRKKKKKKRGKPKKRASKAAEQRRVKSGMSHECSDCGSKERIKVNKAYSASRPRCTACGGPLQRIWIKGAGATRSGTDVSKEGLES